MARVTKFETALRQAFPNVQSENVDLALRLIRGDYSNAELEAVPAVADLISRCYGRPSRHHAVMTALNALLETYGCEYLGHVHMTDGPPVEYLNVGDAYTATLVWYRDLTGRNQWRVQGYADAVEWCERRAVRLDDT